MDNLNLISLNVRGLRGSKRYVIYNYLKENRYHVCLLQETFCTDEFIGEKNRLI